MHIAVGCDHAGFALKETVVTFLRTSGHEVLDCGAYGTEPVDYPDFAQAVGVAIQAGKADRGIIICGSGVGACVAANKMRGVRAGVCHDTYSAHQGVEHDDMNVLCLGARVIGSAIAIELVTAFVDAEFSREDRHLRRLAKVMKLEDEC